MHSVPLLLLAIASVCSPSRLLASATTSGGNARDEAANRRRRSSSDPHPRPRTTITAVVVDATRRHRHRRATAGKYTTTSLLVGRSDDVGKFDETKKDAVSFVRRPPTRCSSRRAASMVRDSTPDDGLLVITCDASGRRVSRFEMKKILHFSIYHTHVHD